MDTLIEKIIKVKEHLMLPLSLEEIYKDIVEEAVSFFSATYASLTLYQNENFHRVYSTLPIAFVTKNRRKGNLYKAFIEKKVQVAHISDTEKAHPELHEMGIETSIFVPILEREAVLGVLTFNFSKEIPVIDTKVFELYASIAASSIRRVQYYEETREALMIRDNFLSIISHEIRTPLTVISGYFELMKKKLEKNESIQLSWVDKSTQEVEKIVSKIKELVDANDIQKGTSLPFTFERINLTLLLENSLKYLQTHYPNRKIMTTGNIPTEMWVVGDVIKLEYVFHNLLENSVKFSPLETITTLQVEEKSDEYRISILDKGQGMTRAEMEKIFQGFYKSMKDSKSGLGIGLYLSHHILQQHRGGLRIVSRLNTGTSVTIRLPKSNI